MTDQFASWKQAWRDSGGATPTKLALLGGFLAVVGVGLAFVIGNPNPSRAEAAITIRASEVAALQEIDKGEQAELLLEGDTAQARNALIPESSLPLARVSGFSDIAKGTPQYSNALKCMTQAIYYEAANEPVQGKRAVAQVVINRMKHPAYPGSVCGVVYEGVYRPVCQFSFTCDGALTRQPLARQWRESEAVAKAMLAGDTEKSVGTATHYHADYVVPRWAYTLAKIDQIGTHIFYRFPGSAGQSGAFTRRWAGRESVPAIDWDRMRGLLAANEYVPEPEYTPGLTVTPHVTDRHAPSDVGGRIDTTKQWRPSIPDPVNSAGSYNNTVVQQVETHAGADVATVSGDEASR
jgi:spore germination cell wall hydrolase CwlJ-like protein